MLVSLGNFSVEVEFTNSELEEQLDIIFQDWQALEEVFNKGPSCRFRLEIADTGNFEPGGDIIGSEVLHPLSKSSDRVTVFKDMDRYSLLFHNGALIQIASLNSPSARQYEVTALISHDQVRASRLEDVLFAGLTPIVRREGLFLTHAFAASVSGCSILLVGPSSSGKTTAGLSLILAGWGYLSNDVAILKKEGSQINALPSPGVIGLSSKTVELLSANMMSQRWNLSHEIEGKYYVPATDVVSSWSRLEPVGVIVFPVVTRQEKSQLNMMDKSVSLAKLVESSIDRWDQSMLESHLDVLYHLIDQSECFELTIGKDVIKWPELLGSKDEMPNH